LNAGYGVIAKRVGTETYWMHTDRLGSINATTDGNGAEILRRSYRAYGELLGESGSHTESRGYIDQRQDGETGLTYLHARVYDSQLGMFLSPDPISADINTYRYGMGNPTLYSDRSGLNPDDQEWDGCLVFESSYTSGTVTAVPSGGYTDSSTVEDRCVEGYTISKRGSVSWSDSFWNYFNNHNYPIAPIRWKPKVPCSAVPRPGCPDTGPTPPTCEELGTCPKPACEELGTCPGTPNTPTSPSGQSGGNGPGSGNEPCRETGTCTLKDLGYYPPMPKGCPSFGAQWTANQRQWDQIVFGDGWHRTLYRAADTVGNIKDAYQVNRTIGPGSLRVIANALFRSKLVLGAALVGGLIGNTARAAGDHIACTPR
jgi:RHS repeat-associated protein